MFSARPPLIDSQVAVCELPALLMAKRVCCGNATRFDRQKDAGRPLTQTPGPAEKRFAPEYYARSSLTSHSTHGARLRVSSPRLRFPKFILNNDL